MAQKRRPFKKPEIVRPTALATTFGGTTVDWRSNRVWNVAAGLFYLVEAVLLWVLGRGLTLPVNLNYLTNDPLQSAAQGVAVQAPASHQWFTLNVLYLVLLALFVAAITHLLAATYFYARYEAALQRRAYGLRWVSGAVCGSLFGVSLGLLMGMQDVAVLLGVVGFCVVGALSGWVVERVDIGTPLRQKLDLVLFGGVSLLPLVLLACYLFGSHVFGIGTPGYLYWLWAVGMAAYVLGAGQLLLTHRQRGRWADYRYADRLYLVLGLATATVLTWLIFGGALH